jgi:Pyridoxamine 5'-phosphate oxidase
VITNQHQQAGLGTAGQEVPRAAAGDDARPMAARLTTEQVWHQIAEASFAVIGYVTPAGEPRSSGVVYKSIRRRLYVAVAPDSWKARHIAASRRVAVTVPVRRGGILSLLAPIPPATISFHGAAIVHPAGSPKVRPLLKELGSLIPVERWTSACIIEILPEGAFLTYGLGVPLRRLRDPAAARARVSVTQEGKT